MKKKKIRKFYKCEEPKCRSGKSSDGLPKFWCQISRASEIEAALIREAGSWESRKPDGWAHQYHNCIRFNQGETVNGEQPFHAVPYWLETNGEAGSERERRLEDALRQMLSYVERRGDAAKLLAVGKAERLLEREASVPR